MKSTIEKRYNVKLRENKFKESIVFNVYNRRYQDRRINVRRKEYELPIISMIADKMTTTICNSQLITDSKLYRFTPLKVFINNYLKCGMSAMSIYGDSLRNYKYNEIYLGENTVVLYNKLMNDDTFVEVHTKGRVDYYYWTDGRLEEIESKTVSVPQFMLLYDEPIWYSNRSQVEVIKIAYNNFAKDVYLSTKKVFMDRQLMRIDPSTGQPLAPDDVAQELFTLVESDMREKADKLFFEYNPDMRTEDNIKSLSYHVGLLTSALGLGNNFICENRTANAHNSIIAWTTSNQELIDTIATYTMMIKEKCETFFSAVEMKKVTFNFNYDFIIDRTGERESDRKDIELGIMSKEEYRVKWYGETKEEAGKNVPKSEIFSVGDIFNNELVGV